MSTAEASSYEVIIEPRRGPFSIDWKAIWNYRDLLFIFARLEYVTKVKQTLLGPVWYILHPLLTSLVFVGVFTEVVKVSSDGIPPMLFFLCGLLAWNYFAQCLGATAMFLSQNSHIFRKVYLPRLIVPFSIVIAKTIPFFIQLAVFLTMYVYVKYFTPAGASIKMTWTVLLLPLFMLQIALLGLGVGLCFAALSIRYRDLQHVVGVLIQLWLYATPVIYPAATVPYAWRGIIAMNPMAPIIESFRQAFFGTAVNWKYIGVSVTLTLFVFLAGLVFFHRVEDTLVDTI